MYQVCRRLDVDGSYFVSPLFFPKAVVNVAAYGEAFVELSCTLGLENGRYIVNDIHYIMRLFWITKHNFRAQLVVECPLSYQYSCVSYSGQEIDDSLANT